MLKEGFADIMLCLKNESVLVAFDQSLQWVFADTLFYVMGSTLEGMGKWEVNIPIFPHLLRTMA